MKHYPGKILLFGEYLVLMGGNALAIPSKDYFGFWDFSNQVDSRLLSILDFIESIEDKLNASFNKSTFRTDIKGYLTFRSNIPLSSGLGSSGALTAAIYDIYLSNKPDSLAEIQNDLALMESFFHGHSSGFDPLVSYLNKPLKKVDSGINVLDNSLSLKYELLNSNINRQGKIWINTFKEKIATDQSFENGVQELKLLNNQLIDHLCHFSELKPDLVFKFAKKQLDVMTDFFVPKMLQLAKDCLEESNFIIKLCGAGGGGFYLKIDLEDTI